MSCGTLPHILLPCKSKYCKLTSLKMDVDNGAVNRLLFKSLWLYACTGTLVQPAWTNHSGFSQKDCFHANHLVSISSCMTDWTCDGSSFNKLLFKSLCQVNIQYCQMLRFSQERRNLAMEVVALEFPELATLIQAFQAGKTRQRRWNFAVQLVGMHCEALT
jgi:hypothetical protein